MSELSAKIWPKSAKIENGSLEIGGCSAIDLVAKYGSPIFILDEADLRTRAIDWKVQLSAAFGANSGSVIYAGKAFLSVEIAKIIEEGKVRDIVIGPGDIFLLPARTPHSPRRPADSVGLVMEVHRPEGVLDAFQWYCEKCTTLLYEVRLSVKDIVKDLPAVMEAFYADSEKCRCKACGYVMEKP